VARAATNLRRIVAIEFGTWRSGLANARSLRQGDKGTVFVSSRLSDKVYAINDQAGKREVKTLYSGLHRPNGLAFANGTLYVAELPKISKVEKIEDNLDNPPKPVVIYDDLPKDEAHGWKFLAIGPDNKLYFNVGAPCNICMPSPAHAQLRRINLDGQQCGSRGTRSSASRRNGLAPRVRAALLHRTARCQRLAVRH
jgi:glucose/arabinose dehydrogenase